MIFKHSHAPNFSQKAGSHKLVDKRELLSNTGLMRKKTKSLLREIWI
jgi:hypothetical protein